MNKFKRIVAWALVLCMVMAFAPVGVSAAGNDYDYSIVHVDAGRKYFSPDSLKTIIDNAAAAGFNQVQLYLSDNQGFRFALDDMTVTTAHGSYDLTPALGDGYSDGSKYPDYTGEYLTQSEMDDIIAYAHEKGIDIVPCINVPGHMGAILEEFTGFRYKKGSQTSKSSIDLNNDEAVAFALALTEKYATYFAKQGCKFYSVGADEYANDLSSMGFEGMGSSMYTKFVQFLNDAADIILDLGMTPRAFNDGFYYRNYNVSVEPNKAYEICYWSSGWNGYNVASASTIANKGHKMINTDGDYYWVVGNSSWQCSATKAAGFSYNKFSGGTTISNPAGAMFCIWSDVANAMTEANVVSKTAPVIDAFGGALPEVESLIETEPEVPETTAPAETEPEVPETTAPVVTEPEDVTVSAGEIAVSAPGLTDVSVAEAETPAIEGASNVVAFDVELSTAAGAYTGEAEITVPVPAGWTNVRGGVLASESGEEVLNIQGKLENGKFTFTAPHFSTVVAYEVEPAAETYEERTITVAVGDTVTDAIEGGNYPGTYADEYVSVSAKYENIPGKTERTRGSTVNMNSNSTFTGLISVNNYYMVMDASGNISGTNDINEATVFSVTRGGSSGSRTYTISNGSRYLSVSNNSLTSSTRAYSWSFSYGFQTSNSYRLTYSDGAWKVVYGSNVTRANLYSYTETTTQPVNQTTVTFTGVSEGTTYVTVGNVRYTVNVVDRAPSNAITASSMTLEYWITNYRVTAGNANTKSITTSTTGVRTEDGAALDSLAPSTGTWDYGNLVYWKSVRLDSANQQTTAGEDDETADGTTITHVRYYNGAWQYKATDGIWRYFVSGDQLVAYYLQPTAVTDQIITLTKDWGYDPAKNTDSPAKGQVALSFAVVDGSTLTPSESDIFAKSTVIFNMFEAGVRDIGVIAPVNNSNYEIYKITVTPGKRSSGTSNNWKTGAPTWEKTTNDLGTGEWFNEREVWNISEGTDPMVSGIADDVKWTAKNTAWLVLFYVRAKNATLNVQYVDDSLGGALITERGVFADQDENFFDLDQTSNVPQQDGPFTLDDNATLTYYNEETEKDIVQTFEKSLLNFADIAPQYRSGAYKYIGAEIADDGKTLILHYNVDQTKLNPWYVVDFGLPVSVEMTDVVKNYATEVESVRVMNAAYGTAVIANDVLTYTPNTVIQSPAAVTLRVTFNNNTTSIINVGFIPASTVAYEEGFAAFTGAWSSTGSKGNGSQTLQTANDHSGNYGYDAKYAAETGMTNGTQAVSTASGDKATLTFTGTGIDIYANCDTTTSTVLVMLKQGSKMVKMYQVDTAALSGSPAATDGQNVLSYNLPIVSIQGLTHGQYTIEIQHTKMPGTAGEFRLDGFRVYNPVTGDDETKYYAADENDPTFLELRNAVLAGLNITESSASDPYNWSGTIIEQVYNDEGSLNGALVLSGNTAFNVQDLLENGPKNELFLQPGDAVTFNLGSATAQIGLKALNGSASYTINGKANTITTSADMFYHEGSTGQVTITNTGDTILSVTKLKIFGASGLAQLSAEQVVEALALMGVIEKPVVNPFSDVTEGDFYYDAVLWALKNGITEGVSESIFAPMINCPRGQVVTFLWRANGSPEPESTVNPFTDLTEDAFYYKAVLWALENGITTGMTATTFGPNELCNRAQVVTFLYRSVGQPAVSMTECPFTDVEAGSWYETAVLWALENGVTTGMSATTFGPTALCNRAQIVTFLYRAFESNQEIA